MTVWIVQELVPYLVFEKIKTTFYWDCWYQAMTLLVVWAGMQSQDVIMYLDQKYSVMLSEENHGNFWYLERSHDHGQYVQTPLFNQSTGIAPPPSYP